MIVEIKLPVEINEKALSEALDRYFAENGDALVIRGEWVSMKPENAFEPYDRKMCNACGWTGPEWVRHYNFCPNCGAKMDKEAEDECDD